MADTEQLDTRVTFRLTPADRAKLERLAAAKGERISSTIRRILAKKLSQIP